ncbi:protein Dcg1p [[Candida] railenensis]|uniref:Protein Dcg1p n=1 Tax=[Candida] railenensis TaxID=45579 RepID=A0A9P0QS38_9ASCO|nr:protein Dcg1p [[Candida] railenensis]
MSISILVINPNSSEKVTKNLEAILKPPPYTIFDFYTAPPDGPPEITPELSELSAKVALPDLLAKDVINKYDGFLVCCYSDHPLVYHLAKHTSKPILGIMQATLLYALSQASVNKSFILTSVNEWEPVLDKGITDFVGSDSFPYKKFQKTKGLDVNVLSLSDPQEFAKIVNRVKSIFDEYKADKIDCVLLGCAGMAGLDEKLTEAFPNVQFIDSVKVGVDLLGGLIRFKSVLP